MREMTCFLQLAALSYLAAEILASRQINSSLNPFCYRSEILYNCSVCLPDCGFNNLLYYKAVGPSDILHYFISTIGVPTVMVVQADLNSTVTVEWSPYFTDSRVPNIFVSNILSAFAFSLLKLYRFNDVGDTGDIAKINETAVESLELSHISWDLAKMGDTAVISSLPKQFGSDGIVTLKINIFGEEGRHDIMPRLMHSDSAGLLELVLANFSNRNVSATRFAAELSVVQFSPNDFNSTSNSSVEVKETSSINDEFSPGVFRTYDISIHSGFLAWKPMVYRTASKGFESATLMSYNPLTHANGDFLQRGLISNFSKGQLLNESDPSVVIRSFNVTFGKPKDKFYNSFNYYSWSMTFGVGKMPKDGFSPLIISLIFACFGLPALAIVAGLGFYLIRRCKRDEDEMNEPLTH